MDPTDLQPSEAFGIKSVVAKFSKDFADVEKKVNIALEKMLTVKSTVRQQTQKAIREAIVNLATQLESLMKVYEKTRTQVSEDEREFRKNFIKDVATKISANELIEFVKEKASVLEKKRESVTRTFQTFVDKAFTQDYSSASSFFPEGFFDPGASPVWRFG